MFRQSHAVRVAKGACALGSNFEEVPKSFLESFNNINTPYFFLGVVQQIKPNLTI